MKRSQTQHLSVTSWSYLPPKAFSCSGTLPTNLHCCTHLITYLVIRKTNNNRLSNHENDKPLGNGLLPKALEVQLIVIIKHDRPMKARKKRLGFCIVDQVKWCL